MQPANTVPDIPQPTGLPAVESRRDGRKQGGNADRGPPPKRVVETYQEADRGRPPDDRVTIIGIPVEQITSSTRAALAGLVAENATLRAQVRRLETQGPAALPVLERDAFIARLGELTAASPGQGLDWVLLLVHVQTYEDIRRSSGLLAANTALADVGQRLRDVKLASAASDTAAAPAVTLPIALVGSAGGLSFGVLATAPTTVDARDLAQQVQQQLTATGYDVAGLSMTLAIKTAGAVVTLGESALLAIARVDHLSRGPLAIG